MIMQTQEVIKEEFNESQIMPQGALLNKVKVNQKAQEFMD